MPSSSCSFLADFKGLNVALHTINFPNFTPDLLVLVPPQLGTENLHTKEEETEEGEEEEAAAVQNFLQPNCKEKLLQVMLLLLLLLLLLMLMAMHLSHAATASNDNDGDGHLLSLKLKITPSDAADDDAIVLLSCATQQTTCKEKLTVCDEAEECVCVFWGELGGGVREVRVCCFLLPEEEEEEEEDYGGCSNHKGYWILWVCEISSSSHLFEDFFLVQKEFLFLPVRISRDPSSSIDELLLMMMMLIRASPAMFSM
jgi:hypothetical protein